MKLNIADKKEKGYSLLSDQNYSGSIKISPPKLMSLIKLHLITFQSFERYFCLNFKAVEITTLRIPPSLFLFCQTYAVLSPDFSDRFKQLRSFIFRLLSTVSPKKLNSLLTV